jgi:hypothetical protein
MGEEDGQVGELSSGVGVNGPVLSLRGCEAEFFRLVDAQWQW